MGKPDFRNVQREDFVRGTTYSDILADSHESPGNDHQRAHGSLNAPAGVPLTLSDSASAARYFWASLS